MPLSLSSASPASLQILAAVLFGLAVLHTFCVRYFALLAHRFPHHAGVLHLLGEVEVVFGLWSVALLAAIALMIGPAAAVAYAESRQFTEPLFVFVVMVVAASRPVLDFAGRALSRVAGWMPFSAPLAEVWLGLAAVPILGSLITEPAAMTLAALMLAPRVFRPEIPRALRYAALGTLFVNVSIGGTLTAYAAPPVLMVAGAWDWDSSFMFATFGWKAALATFVNATVVCVMLRGHVTAGEAKREASKVPAWVSFIHCGFLAAVVVTAHHPVIFIALFLLFIGFTQAYATHQSPLIFKEALLVACFLAGLVVLGGMQQWWLQPIVSNLSPLALFFGALGLTAITDNAALTYLGSLIEGISAESQYMLVAGAVAGGGLTVIANAPNPAGVALLRGGFANGSIGVPGLLAGAALPTAVAAAAFLLL